jgi:uncharacterized glyoxalase superfamily protein PhnB
MPATEVKSATIYAGVLYEDADKAIEWLERLGFERREIHRDEGGAVAHGELTFGGSILMIGTAGVGREPFASVPAGGTMTYVAVDEIDGLYERARASGAEVALEIMDTDYGSRDFTLRDPEGNLWAFGTYRPEAG